MRASCSQATKPGEGPRLGCGLQKDATPADRARLPLARKPWIVPIPAPETSVVLEKSARLGPKAQHEQPVAGRGHGRDLGDAGRCFPQARTRSRRSMAGTGRATPKKTSDGRGIVTPSLRDGDAGLPEWALPESVTVAMADLAETAK
jgi:hypothetical protein